MAEFHRTRCEKLRKLLKKSNADAMLVTDFVNVTWLTGFTGDDSYLLVFPDGEVLISDSRFMLQVPTECPGLDYIIRDARTTMLGAVQTELKKAFPRQSPESVRLAVEADRMTLAIGRKLEEKVTPLLVPLSGMVDDLRQIKDKAEVELIRQAGKIAKNAFLAMRATLAPHKTEKQLAAELEYTMRLLGAKGEAFPSIVAVDAHAANCHAVPRDVALEGAGMLLVDWGANFEGYLSDLTRTVVLGEMTKEFRKIYKIVLDAQLKAIDAIQPGKKCSEIDAIARNHITKHGYGTHFGHGLGHGLGMYVHESPRFGVTCDTELRPGMVMTVEPGIYIEGWGGIRIEDDILVTRRGCEVLTDVPKDLADIVVN